MANRLSNRERIQRRAMEVEAKEKEREEKKAAKQAGGGEAKKRVRTAAKKKEAAPQERLKVVWTVYDDRLKEVASFPYPQKEAADEKAAALTQKSGREHVVRPSKVPTDE